MDYLIPSRTDKLTITKQSNTKPDAYLMGYTAYCFSVKNEHVTSSNGNIFRITGLLCGEFTGQQWIPRIKASDEGFFVFFDLRLEKRLSKQSLGWWFETPSRSLWRHCNEEKYLH